MINKNMFSIKNVKKVMHKIGKKWMVVPVIALGLLTGGATVETGMNHASADTNPDAALDAELNGNLNSAASSPNNQNKADQNRIKANSAENANNAVQNSSDATNQQKQSASNAVNSAQVATDQDNANAANQDAKNNPDNASLANNAKHLRHLAGKARKAANDAKRANGTTPGDLAHKNKAAENAAKAKSATDAQKRQEATNKSIADSMARANASASASASKAAASVANALNNNQNPSGYNPLPGDDDNGNQIPGVNPESDDSMENSEAQVAESVESAYISESTSNSISESNAILSQEASENSAADSEGASADNQLNSAIQSAQSSAKAKGVTGSNLNSIVNNATSSIANSLESSEGGNHTPNNTPITPTPAPTPTPVTPNSNSNSNNNNDSSAISNNANSNSNNGSSVASDNGFSPIVPNTPFVPFALAPTVPSSVSSNAFSSVANTPIFSNNADNNNLVIITPKQSANASNTDVKSSNAKVVKPARVNVVRNVNAIKRNHTADYRGVRVTNITASKALRTFYKNRISMHARHAVSIKGDWLYSNILGGKRYHVSNLRRNAKVTIKRAFAVKFTRHGKSYIRLEVRIGHGSHARNYFMTGNYHNVRLFK